MKDGKTLRGRLLDKDINRPQNYFDIAICANCHSVKAMQSSIGAVVYHCSEANRRGARHMFCDKGETTWCKYQKPKLEGTAFVDKPDIPIVKRDLILPVFTDLSKPDLLKKCLHGKTQNNNECLNGVVWKRIPKYIFVGRKVLEIGICSAIINFNDGATGFCKCYEKTMFDSTHIYCYKTDGNRIKSVIGNHQLSPRTVENDHVRYEKVSVMKMLRKKAMFTYLVVFNLHNKVTRQYLGGIYLVLTQ